MKKLKELIEKVYNNLQNSEWIDEYPELKEQDVVAEVIQSTAIEIMPDYIPKDKLEEFTIEAEKNYKEETFKKYINNYSKFLNDVEQEFYGSLLIGLTETES